MNNDLNKKKINLLKGILDNPKLSRVFSDALSSPIGSTKRQQSKSILSIMKKLGGIRNDGQGGPGLVYSQTNTPSYKQPKDYSNMIIFPAAPKFKVKKEVKKMDGQGGPGDFSFPSSSYMGNIDLFGQPRTYTAPEGPKSPFRGISPAIKKGWSAVGETGYNIGQALKPRGSFGGYYSGALSPFGTVSESTPVIAGKYGAPEKSISDYPSFHSSFPSLTGGILKPTTPKPQGPVVSPEGDTTSAPITTETTGQAPQPKVSGAPEVPGITKETPTDVIARAQAAVNRGTGPVDFAMGVAGEKYGGDLGKYLDEEDTKIKKDLKVDEIEQSLSDITSMKANFVPTIENYIRGKDEYLKTVDSMINQVENQMFEKDMSDPEVRARAEKHLAYLYTLKGRQNQRYGQLLNNAIADYNADSERIQNQYNSVYKQYNDTITRKAAITQNEYNNTYARMADLYNNLQDAPIRKLNQVVLEQQALKLHLETLSSNTKFQTIDYLKEQNEYKDWVVDKNGVLLPSDVLHLPSLYGKIIEMRKSPKGLTDKIGTGMAMGMSIAKKDEGENAALSLTKNYRNMINGLAKTEGGLTYASQLASDLARNSNALISSYVFNNLPKFKQAVGSLVSGGWVGKSYLAKNDKEGWIKEYKSIINENILEDIYDAIKINQNQVPEWSKNPEKIFTETKDANGNTVDLGSLSNVSDDLFKNKITGMVTNMWEEEPNISANQ